MEEGLGTALMWKALSDPSRRRILDLLRAGPSTTGQVAAAFEISRIAVMRHLSVLAEAGLVVSRKRGRERRHYINALPLVGIEDRWVEPLPAAWARTLLRLAEHAERAPADVSLSIDIAQEHTLKAKRRDVFRSLTKDVASWWGAPYLTNRATGLELDPRLGGSFKETWGAGGGKLLATVTAIEPERLLELTGPLHLGVVFGVAEFRLEDDPHGTRLSFTHRGIGEVSPDVAEAFAGGWAELLGHRLRRFVERGGAGGIADEAKED
jgi:DNA-binding transcriptional ArsR family regulator